jgi:predicted phage terminase large subunit-like protein
MSVVQQTQKYYGARFMTIEQAASGQSLIQVLERESKIHIHAFKPLKSKTIRLQTVCPLLEAGRVKFVEGAWVAPFVKEFTAFPYCPHDDKTDAVVWALTYYMFHLDGSAHQASDMLKAGAGRSSDRQSLFKEFGEVKTGKSRQLLTAGESSWFFGGGMMGETNANRSGGRRDIRYDVGID